MYDRETVYENQCPGNIEMTNLNPFCYGIISKIQSNSQLAQHNPLFQLRYHAAK